MEAIKTDKLTKKYKNLTAVDSLDLLVEQGELFALLGVNGAGKTTTIKMLSCLTKPTGGDAYLNGNSIVSDPAAVKNVIGVSPQETGRRPRSDGKRKSGADVRRSRFFKGKATAENQRAFPAI